MVKPETTIVFTPRCRNAQDANGRSLAFALAALDGEDCLQGFL